MGLLAAEWISKELSLLKNIYILFLFLISQTGSEEATQAMEEYAAVHVIGKRGARRPAPFPPPRLCMSNFAFAAAI